MKMKILLPLLVVALVALTVNPVIADIIEGEGSGPFYFVQKYSLTIPAPGPYPEWFWLPGPAAYYGEKVLVICTALNTWEYTVYDVDSTVKYELLQVGTAEIYGAGVDGVLGTGDDVLLGTFDFKCEEEWFDENGDASFWMDGWYAPAWWSDDMEELKYEWTIKNEDGDIYEYIVTAEDGEWNIFWESGEVKETLGPY